MADITNLFKATVKTVKTRQKAQGVNIGPDKSILGVSHKKSEFGTQSLEVVHSITKLRDFLAEHRKDYINASSHLGREVSKMTDAERDQIDSDAEKFMRVCSDSIKVIKSRESKNVISPQVKEHRDAILALIESYLKVVCKLYSEQRAVRVKRVVDKKRISRLEPEKKASRGETFQSRLTRTEKQRQDPLEGTRVVSEEPDKKKQKQQPQSYLLGGSEEEEELSPEEVQMFQAENEQLYQDMNSMVDEVKQIEGKVVEIAQLQEIFAEKVLEQDKDIDRIGDTVMGTTENIKEANEDIREAMKNNAGLRVWILFFLIICSFSLLFLDWYNA